MGSFRSLSPGDVRDVLVTFGLSPDEFQSHEPIAAGTINTNVLVKTASATWFLRVNEGKSEDEVAREAAIVSHAAARGVSTPLPRPARDGRLYAPWQDSWISIFPWVPGRTLRRDEVGVSQGRQVGEALARLHLAGTGYPDHRPGRYEPDEISRRFAAIATRADPNLRAAVETLGPELARLSTVRRSDLPTGLIHGDLFIDNVLFTDDGRLSALLDFEQASWGRLAYDVAVTLLAFAFGREGFRDDVARALLDGYCRLRAPLESEQEGFGAELAFAACRFAVTRITDVYLRRGQGAPGGKDFNRYLQRLARVKQDWRPQGGALSFEADR